MTTNNFKPILFSTEMVQAILAGRKTQTRRIVKPQPNYFPYTDSKEGHEKTLKNYIDEGLKNRAIKGKYQIGDVLWVRESATIFKVEGITGFHRSGEKPVGYKSIQKIGIKYINGERIEIYYPERLSLNIKCGNKLSNGVFKEAARIFLKVTNVRCERLQDISEEDAISEGIDRFENSLFNETRYRDYTDGKRRDKDFNRYPEMAKQVGYSHYGGNPWPDWRDPITSFQSLWDSINAKKHPWESNPWVWVYEFERIEKPENINNQNFNNQNL